MGSAGRRDRSSRLRKLPPEIADFCPLSWSNLYEGYWGQSKRGHGKRRNSCGIVTRAQFGLPSTRRGCRICVTVQLPVRPRGETMYWQANANTPLSVTPPFKCALVLYWGQSKRGRGKRRNSCAIVHERQRNSSHKEELVARHFPMFFRVSRRNYCAIVAQLGACAMTARFLDNKISGWLRNRTGTGNRNRRNRFPRNRKRNRNRRNRFPGTETGTGTVPPC